MDRSNYIMWGLFISAVVGTGLYYAAIVHDVNVDAVNGYEMWGCDAIKDRYERQNELILKNMNLINWYEENCTE